MPAAHNPHLRKFSPEMGLKIPFFFRRWEGGRPEQACAVPASAHLRLSRRYLVILPELRKLVAAYLATWLPLASCLRTISFYLIITIGAYPMGSRIRTCSPRSSCRGTYGHALNGRKRAIPYPPDAPARVACRPPWRSGLTNPSKICLPRRRP
jgi:hypothetical protein